MQLSLTDKIIYFLFPSWMLNTTPWKDLWDQFEEERLLKQYRYLLPLCGVGYLAHYFLVDGPLGLTKDPVWFYYRFGIFALSILCLGLTFLGQSKVRSAQIAYWVFMIATCWAQARSMVWYSGVSPIWPIIIATIFAICYRSDLFFSLIVLTSVLAMQYPSFRETQQNSSLLVGAIVVAYIFLVSIKKSRLEEVQSFINNQRQIEVERTLSEVQQSLADQIRAFLPAKINKDLKYYLRNGASVTQAIDEVLRPQQKTIVCLFSDIRGFTEKSKKLDYIRNHALPNIKSGTTVIEEFGGIPRLIGDLIFAYFERDNSNSYLVNAFDAAVELLKENTLKNQNRAKEEKIIRYIILDTGIAICGNMGSSVSAREITALGMPVNRCARIDELTKNQKIREVLGEQAIVMSESFVNGLQEAGYALQANSIRLKQIDLEIRDFNDENLIYYTDKIQSLQVDLARNLSKEVA